MAQIGCCRVTDPEAVNDAVCTVITLTDTNGAPIPIYDDSSGYTINGTILVENNGLGNSPSAALVVNGSQIGGFVISPGLARAITVADINSIGIIGAGTGTAEVKISFSLNYRFL